MRELQVCGVDDGYFPLKFKGGKGKTVLLSSKYNDKLLIGIDFDLILVDGDDATSKLRKILDDCEVVFTDGITVGGFNYVDPEELRNYGINYIIFYSKIPNIKDVEHALLKHFSGDRRTTIILNVLENLVLLPTKKGNVYVDTNLSLQYASKLINYYQIYVKEPEPLRTAHTIASSLSRFLLTKNLLT